MVTTHPERNKRRAITLLLSVCTLVLCLLIGVQAYVEPQASAPPPTVTPMVSEVILAAEPTLPTQGDIDALVPEVPIPYAPPIDPIPVPEPELTAMEVVEKPEPRTHVVVKGETLSSISVKYYGSPNRWQEIYRANQAVIPNKNSIKVGTVLAIP